MKPRIQEPKISQYAELVQRSEKVLTFLEDSVTAKKWYAEAGVVSNELLDFSKSLVALYPRE